MCFYVRNEQNISTVTQFIFILYEIAINLCAKIVLYSKTVHRRGLLLFAFPRCVSTLPEYKRIQQERAFV